MKLAQAIAQLYGISRRAATDLIDRRQIRVNGQIIDQFSLEVNPGRDRIESLSRLKTVSDLRQHAYILYYKPVGLECTLCAKANTLREIIRRIGIASLKPVGRLDLDSEGLLLLTDDGDLNNYLTRPGAEVAKLYEVVVDSKPTEAQLDQMHKLFRKIQYLAPKGFQIELREGKHRQIRRLCVEAGLTVVKLKRQKMSALTLGDLKPGEWRHLKAVELKALKNWQKS